MLVTLLGIVTLVRLVQPLNAYRSDAGDVVPSVTLVRLEQS